LQCLAAVGTAPRLTASQPIGRLHEFPQRDYAPYAPQRGTGRCPVNGLLKRCTNRASGGTTTRNADTQ